MAERTQFQTNDSDGREIVHHGPAVEVDEVTQEQSHQQVFPAMETASYSNLEQVGTEQGYPGRHGSPAACYILVICDRPSSDH